MRAVLAVCLLAACAGVIRPAAGPQRVELPGGSWSIVYRLVLDDPAAPRLEGRVEVTNTTAEDWTDATLTLANRLIVSRDVIPGAVSRFEITEHQPHRLDRPLAGIPSAELRIYIDGSKLPAGVEELLRTALTHVRERETGELALAGERSKLDATARRGQQSGRPLDRATRTELDDIGRAIGQAAALLERERAVLDDLAAKLPTW